MKKKKGIIKKGKRFIKQTNQQLVKKIRMKKERETETSLFMEKSPYGFLVSTSPPFLSSRVPNLHLHGDANVDRVDEKRRADRRLDFLTELTFHKTIHKWCFSCGEKEGIDEAAERWIGCGGGVHRMKSSSKSVSIHECMWKFYWEKDGKIQQCWKQG